MAWDDRYQKEMLRRLKRRITRLEIQDCEKLLRELEIEQIIAAYSIMVVDKRTQPHLRLAALVLASYHALTTAPLEPQETFELIDDIFTGIRRTTLRLYTLALLTFSRDAYTAITRAGKRRALEQYGREWDFRIEETERCFPMTATKCFYADFFRAVAMPQLTQVFCHWDQNWIKPIDPTKHKIRFMRPTTIGYGGKECPFIFERIA